MDMANPPSTPRSRGDCLLVHHSHDCEAKRPSVGPYAMGVVDADAVEATRHHAATTSTPAARGAVAQPSLPACRSSHVTVDQSSSTPHGAAGGAGMPSPLRA